MSENLDHWNNIVGEAGANLSPEQIYDIGNYTVTLAFAQLMDLDNPAKLAIEVWQDPYEAPDDTDLEIDEVYEAQNEWAVAEVESMVLGDGLTDITEYVETVDTGGMPHDLRTINLKSGWMYFERIIPEDRYTDSKEVLHVCKFNQDTPPTLIAYTAHPQLHDEDVVITAEAAQEVATAANIACELVVEAGFEVSKFIAKVRMRRSHDLGLPEPDFFDDLDIW